MIGEAFATLKRYKYVRKKNKTASLRSNEMGKARQKEVAVLEVK